MKSFGLLVLGIALIGVVLASVSSPIALLSASPNGADLIPKVTVHSVNSDTIIVTGSIDVALFRNKWAIDFVFDFEGAEITGADYTRSTTSVSSSSYTSSVKPSSKTQIKTSPLAWPEESNPTYRTFKLVLKVKNVAATGFKIKPTSFFSADKGEIKQLFADVPSASMGTFGKMVTAFKPKSRKSAFDPIFADLDFTVKDLKIAKGTVSEQGLILTDLLDNSKFTGEKAKVMCTVGTTQVETLITAHLLTFTDITPFTGVSSVRVVCPKELQINLGKEEGFPRVWNLSYRDDTKEENFIAQHSQVKLLTGFAGFSKVALIVIASVIALVLLGAIVICLKVCKVGCFKPKDDQYSQLINRGANSSDYRAL